MAGDISTASGSKIYIGPAVTSATDTLMEFQQITAWTEIGLVENMGEVGDESTEVKGAAIGDSRVRKAKGARDGGSMALVCFHDPDDTGQLAVEDAETTDNNYAFKVVLADGPAGETNSVLYFRGLVMSQRINVGTNDNIMRRNFNIGVNSPVIYNPATT